MFLCFCTTVPWYRIYTYCSTFLILYYGKFMWYKNIYFLKKRDIAAQKCDDMKTKYLDEVFTEDKIKRFVRGKYNKFCSVFCVCSACVACDVRVWFLFLVGWSSTVHHFFYFVVKTSEFNFLVFCSPQILEFHLLSNYFLFDNCCSLHRNKWKLFFLLSTVGYFFLFCFKPTNTLSHKLLFYFCIFFTLF